MEIVWEAGWDEFSVSQVQAALAATRDLAYTTVMTTVSRLFDKELLTRRMVGRKYMYSPAMGRVEFIEAMTREVLTSLPPVGQQAAVALLVERVAEAETEELDRLEALIRERRRKSGG